MDRRLFVISALYLLVSCQGLELSLNRQSSALPGDRKFCGVLTCEETNIIPQNDTTDQDQDKSVGLFKTIASMSMFKTVSADSKTNTKNKQDVLFGSVSSQTPILTRVTNGRKVSGLLEAGRATMRVELVKQEDCEAEYTCQVRGLDTQGKEIVSSTHLVQHSSSTRDQVDSKRIISANSNSLQLLGSLQQLVTQSINSLELSLEDKIGQLQNRMEDRILELQKEVADRSGAFENRVEDKIGDFHNDFRSVSDSLERRLEDRLDSFENRMEDKIDNNSNLNKLIQLDSKVSAELAQFRIEAKTDMENSLDAMRQKLQGEQRQALRDVSENFEMDLNKTYDLLHSMDSDFDLLKAYGQRNLDTVENQTETIREMLTSADLTSRCRLSDTTDLHKPQTCYSGMRDTMNETYPRYAIMKDDTLHKEILCDTKTLGGGWIVIQRRASADENFFRSWEDYKNGFGDPSGNFWLGNDAIHNLTYKYPHELRIDMKVNDQDVFAEYTTFRIEAESDNYRLRLGSYYGTVGESTGYGLSYSDNSPFSTFDEDNDESSLNCAEKYHGAWWYKSCHDSNLNGLWGVREQRGVSWSPGSGDVYPTFTEMKVRRI
ncbi:hypothetical protein RRG08_008442 [Elysia crispata]|uniref:Fibrinogen C-terminal domain-containing protein n=1 Tax=Elysia crispata TaxID=231223 RepID=A0AAE1B0G4_9GAST|nr:hypothetical protein RRG08_008442 [Elysia crispata]